MKTIGYVRYECETNSHTNTHTRACALADTHTHTHILKCEWSIIMNQLNSSCYGYSWCFFSFRSACAICIYLLRNNLNDLFVNENVVPYLRIRDADKEKESLEITVAGFVIYHADDFVSAFVMLLAATISLTSHTPLILVAGCYFTRSCFWV